MYVCFDLFFPNTVSEGQFYKTPKLDHYFLDLNNMSCLSVGVNGV